MYDLLATPRVTLVGKVSVLEVSQAWEMCGRSSGNLASQKKKRNPINATAKKTVRLDVAISVWMIVNMELQHMALNGDNKSSGYKWLSQCFPHSDHVCV